MNPLKSAKPWRKLYHFLAGVIIALSYYFLDRELMLIGLGISVVISLLIECVRFKCHNMNLWLVKRFSILIKPKEECRITGQTYLVIGSFLTVLFFPKKEIAITSLAFLATGDVAGSVIGRLLGKTKLPITKLTKGKTVEGTTACFLACLCIGLLFRLILSDLRIEVTLLGAFTAALMESLSIPPDDNLTVPLSTGLIMSIFDAML